MSIIEALIETFGEIFAATPFGGRPSKTEEPNYEFRPPGNGAIYISILLQTNSEIDFPGKLQNALAKGLYGRLSAAGYVVTHLESDEELAAEENSYLIRVGPQISQNEQKAECVLRYELCCNETCELIMEVPMSAFPMGSVKNLSRNVVPLINKALYKLRAPEFRPGQRES